MSAQLSWSHFVVLIYLNNKEERLFYEQQTIQNAWSVRELRRQIRSNLYGRMKIKGEMVIAPITEIVEPEQVFKDSYNFDFLKLPEKYSEEDLKTALLNTFSFKKRKPVLKEKQKISCGNLSNLWL
ncbi:MAG: DUF1016 family protein [Methanophagales archaeon]|nr:DUF1016 family protein [Methanophagales archaeon]